VSLTVGPEGRYAVEVGRGKGREAATFLSSERNGEVSVLPADAIPLLKAGRLDPALFNVTQLVKQGYTDAKTDATPLIATYTKGSSTPDGARRTLALPGIGGAALSAKKSTAFWADIAPALGTEPTAKAARRLGDGIDKLWLDAKVSASLDVSVPQIGAPEVWQAGYDGKGVKVAVLDTGVDANHPDLTGKIAESTSFVPDESVQDGHGHGTHVAPPSWARARPPAESARAWRRARSCSWAKCSTTPAPASSPGSSRVWSGRRNPARRSSPCPWAARPRAPRTC
jgi:hypothetical protein